MSLDLIYSTESLFANLAEQFLGINHREGIIPHSTHYASNPRKAVLFRGSIEMELPYDHPLVENDFHANPRRMEFFEIIITEYHNVFVNWKNVKPKTSSEGCDPSLFENTGNHDSCWRSSGFTKMFEITNMMCEDINAHLLEKGYEAVAPAKMKMKIDFGSFIGMCPILFCEVEAKKKDGNTYFMDLTSITLKKLTASFTED